MEIYDDMSETPQPTDRGRKRKHTDRVYQQVGKLKRACGGFIPSVSCNHRSTPLCCADQLGPDTVVDLFTNFCSLNSQAKQSSMLISLMDVSAPSRIRIDDTNRKRGRDVTIKYNVITATTGRLPVCKASFMSILNVKKDRLSRLANDFLKEGTPRKERRGGSRQTTEIIEFKKQIESHIQTFSCRASHYARRGAPGRKYLPSDLSVAKMRQLFIEQNHQQVSYALYYSVFLHSFNLSFGHPAKDICSDCLRFKIQLRQELPDAEKRAKAVCFMIHRRRARKYYDIMNNVEDSLTLCFDVMENLVLPKTCIGQAYYSRQLYMYVFAVVRHEGRGQPVPPNNIFLYTWMESENRKDSNVISSALEHALTKWIGSFNGNRIRLFSDSCYGQNKNFSMVSMLHAFRKQLVPNNTFEYYFPIRGHSFLPADRVFGRIEQDIRKKDLILLPSDYVTILKKHGTVFQYGSDWRVKDFKKGVSSFLKTLKGFKISDARVLRIRNDKVGFKAVYEGPFCEHSVLKKGKRWIDFVPEVMGDVSCVKDAKKKDVLNLLGSLGVADETKAKYVSWFQSVAPADRNESDDED